MVKHIIVKITSFSAWKRGVKLQMIDDEIKSYQEYLQSVSHIIIQLAREGGFDSAANF